MSSSWGDERRRNLAADREQTRKDKDADADRRRKEREAEDKRRRDERRSDREEKREERLQRRRDRAQRRRERAARRKQNLTPGNVYRKGTLALVTASALASLPAQIMHFVGISAMLLPLPFALEGAAWVMNAGVAYADERRLPGWVRWLLRGFALAAAGFAAYINYGYGATKDPAAGWGLAAVTLLGPLFFEVRQWVATLAAAGDPKRREEKRKKKHEEQRRKHHGDVVKLAETLMSAATYNTLSFEKAFAAAWQIKYGTQTPGMTPALHAEAYQSQQALAAAFNAANGSPESMRSRLLEVLHPAPAGLPRGVTQSGASSQVATDLPPSPEKAPEGPRKKIRKAPPPHRRSKGDALPFHPLAKNAAAVTANKVTAVNGHHA